MVQESGGQDRARSWAGAMGLMQVMPFHACASWEPRANIFCGTYILAQAIQRNDGDWRPALAEYNAGVIGAWQRGQGWSFADKVLAIYRRHDPNG